MIHLARSTVRPAVIFGLFLKNGNVCVKIVITTDRDVGRSRGSRRTLDRGILEFGKLILFEVMICLRGLDFNKRTVTTHSHRIGNKIWPLYEQLSIFFHFYWPHLGLN